MSNQKNFNGVWVAVGLSVIAVLLSLGTLVWQPAPPQPSGDVESLGVTNLDSLHLSDTGGTATPVLRVNQDGAGKIAEFLDGGTVVASINDGGGWESAGGFKLNGQQLAVDTDDDSTIQASLDDVITMTLGAATGHVGIATGGFKVGNGFPGETFDGEDAYVEGGLEVDGATYFDGTVDSDGAVTLNSTLDVDGNISSGTGALTFTTNVLANSFVIYGEQSVVEATSAGTITATGTYQPITSTAVVTLGTTAIADGSTEGQYLCLVNENASDTVAISTGQNTVLSGNTVLGANDMLCVIWDGTNWVEQSQVDNS